ncbi:MAG: hypothetical protein WCL49_05355 [bacterium]
MRGLTRPYQVWIAALGASLSAVLVQAAVFQTGGGTGGNLFDPGSFGRSLYRTAMQINGGRAEVSVIACDEGKGSLRAAFKTHEQAGTGCYVPGESLGVGQVTRDGRTLRLVTLKSSSEAPLLMVAVAQSVSEAKASQSSEGRHQIDEIPIPSGSRVLSFQRNDDSRTSLERLTVRMATEGVRRYYDAILARDGWSRLLSETPESGLMVFVKGASVCCVGVGAADSYGESRVTLLHKQGAVK